MSWIRIDFLKKIYIDSKGMIMKMTKASIKLVQVPRISPLVVIKGFFKFRIDAIRNSI